MSLLMRRRGSAVPGAALGIAAVKADGTLALIDTQGHIWTYRREQ